MFASQKDSQCLMQIGITSLIIQNGTLEQWFCFRMEILHQTSCGGPRRHKNWVNKHVLKFEHHLLVFPWATFTAQNTFALVSKYFEASYSRSCFGFNLFHVLIFNLGVMQVIKQEGLSRTASECTLFDLFKYNDVNDDEHLTREEFYAAFGECFDKVMKCTKLRDIFSCIISTIMAECAFSNCDTYCIFSVIC